MSVIFRDQSVDQNTTKLSTPKSKRYILSTESLPTLKEVEES